MEKESRRKNGKGEERGGIRKEKAIVCFIISFY